MAFVRFRDEIAEANYTTGRYNAGSMRDQGIAGGYIVNTSKPRISARLL
jgi:hypothetical protein